MAVAANNFVSVSIINIYWYSSILNNNLKLMDSHYQANTNICGPGSNPDEFEPLEGCSCQEQCSPGSCSCVGDKLSRLFKPIASLFES